MGGVEFVHGAAGPLLGGIPAHLHGRRFTPVIDDEIDLSGATPVMHLPKASPQQQENRTLQLLATVVPRGGHGPPPQAGVDGVVLPIADDPLPLRPGEKRATDREVSAFRRIDVERGGVDGDAQRRRQAADARLRAG